jgi:HSP20 family protein
MLPTITNRRFFPSIVEDLFNDDLFPGFIRNNTGITIPAVNIVESKDDYRIEVAAPGLDKNDIKIEVEENVLVISSEKEDRKEDENEKYTRKEFSYSSFRRTFTLPEGVSKDKIKASHKDGVLTISVPKEDAEKSRFKKLIKIA